MNGLGLIIGIATAIMATMLVPGILYFVFFEVLTTVTANLIEYGLPAALCIVIGVIVGVWKKSTKLYLRLIFLLFSAGLVAAAPTFEILGVMVASCARGTCVEP